MPDTKFEERKESVKELYKSVLNRDADDGGLEHYSNSNLSLEEIKEALEGSLEYSQLHKKENLQRDVQAAGNKELLVMGSTPDKQQHLKMLLEAGIQAILCLDEKVTYDAAWCKHFLHVPLSLNAPIPEQSMEKCMDFLSAMMKQNKKIFIHSKSGVERAPIVLSLFLVASQNMSLGKALRVVSTKRAEINPRKSLVTSKLLQCVYDYRKNLKDPNHKPSKEVKTAVTTTGKLKQSLPVKVSDSLYVGSSIETDQLGILKANGIKTIIDLNEKSSKISSSIGSWFAHMKIPVKGDQLSRIMPVVLKTANKYMLRNPVYVLCSNPAVLFMFLDVYSSTLGEDDTADKLKVEGAKKSLMV